jgi:hypothetical protein
LCMYVCVVCVCECVCVCVCVCSAISVLFSSRALSLAVKSIPVRLFGRHRTIKLLEAKPSSAAARKFHVDALRVQHCLMWGPEVMLDMDY